MIGVRLKNVKESQRSIDYKFLVLVNSICLVLFVFLGQNDFSLAAKLSQYSDSAFTRFTDQSIFDGKPLGLSDIPILLNLLILCMGLVAKLTGSLSSRWVLIAKYLLTTNLIFGILVIHGLKNTIGRARPYLSLNETSLYTEFWNFGVFDAFKHSFSGSLPSGHTATILALLPLVFCLRSMTHKSMFRGRRLLGFTLILGVSLVMAIGRVMAKDHYLSDCVVTIFLGWNFHYFMFYFVYDLPTRLRYGVIELGWAKTVKCASFLILILGSLQSLKTLL